MDALRATRASAEPFWPDHSPHFLTCRLAVRAYLRAHAPSTALPLTVALSGGPDSLALLAAIAAEVTTAEVTTAEAGDAPVRAIVVDHGLQEGSADVAKQAARVAERLGVPADIVRVSVAKEGSLEDAARAVRYRALFEVAPGDVLVGHTADDQAETLLLGALRGNPVGMSECAPFPLPEAAGSSRLLGRPLLGVRRDDTVGACAELGLSPWHDPHNADPDFLRVAIRTHVLPALAEAAGADPTHSLATTASRIADDNRALGQWAEKVQAAEVGEKDVDTLKELPAAVRRRVIADFLRDGGANVTGKIVAGVDRLIVNWRGQGGVACGARAGRRLEVHRVDGKLVIVEQTGQKGQLT